MSSPPQVTISTTTGSVDAACWAAAVAASCPGLTQLALALVGFPRRTEPAAKNIATAEYKIFLIVGSPC